MKIAQCSKSLLLALIAVAVPSFSQDRINARTVIRCTETICDHVYSNGYLFVVARGPSLNVVAGGLVDTGHHMFLEVAVKNRSTATPIDVIPENFSLSGDLANKSKPLSYVKPEQATRAEGGASRWANIFDGIAAGAATQKTTVRTSGNATYVDHSSDGTTTTGTLSANSNSVIRTPDYAAREAARNRIAERNLSVTAKRTQLLNAALKASTVNPNNAVQGIVFFERDKNSNKYVLTVPIGDVDYVFEMTLKR